MERVFLQRSTKMTSSFHFLFCLKPEVNRQPGGQNFEIGCCFVFPMRALLAPKYMAPPSPHIPHLFSGTYENKSCTKSKRKHDGSP